MRKCETKYCKNKSLKGRKVCGKCKNRKYRKKNPERAAYQSLKNNAKRRGKEFDLTFEEFLKFVHKTEYMLGKGRSKTSLHIDRIDEEKGYVKGNIQVLTNTENVRKYLNWELNHKGVPTHFRMATVRNRTRSEDDPF